METPKVKKRIVEISMIKGIGILYVIFLHMLFISGLASNCAALSRLANTIVVPLMLMFFLLSGYVTHPHAGSLASQLGKRVKAMLIPYYKVCAGMLIVYAIIYLGIERQSLAWYADGALCILFQLQSFHLFDASIVSIHPMYYGALAGWFVFQMAISSCIFLPLLRKFQNKPSYWKLLTSVLLLALGGVFYVLNLQGLNGKVFPTICALFVLPNIPGIAGILLLGNYLADINYMDIEGYSAMRRIISVIVSFLLIVMLYLTDDGVYAFPDGKWGTNGVIGFATSTIYTVALTTFLGIICYWIKRFLPLKNAFAFFGDNSLDVLNVHFFFGYLIAYLGGFWFCFVNEPAPDLSVGCVLKYILLVILVPLLSYLFIRRKKIEAVLNAAE